MPYIKPRDPPYAQFRRLLLGYGLDSAELAEVLGCAFATAKRRMDDPALFTLGDIAKISRRAHIPIEEIRACITQ